MVMEWVHRIFLLIFDFDLRIADAWRGRAATARAPKSQMLGAVD
jgi:hypothetical protein